MWTLQVLASMNAAYKQEKKNAKRRARSITYEVTEPVFDEASPPCKKLKDSLFLSFPVEGVLSTEQNGPGSKKSDLEYPLPGSDVH